MTAAAAAAQHSVFTEAYAISDFGDGPLYAEIRASKAFCERLLELQEICATHALSEVRSHGGPDNWGPEGIEDELRLANDELVVCGETFWFTARPKHADYTVESRAIRIRDLVRTLDNVNGPRFFGEDPGALEALVAEHETAPAP